MLRVANLWWKLSFDRPPLLHLLLAEAAIEADYFGVVHVASESHVIAIVSHPVRWTEIR